MKKIPVILALVAVAVVAYSMSNWTSKTANSIRASNNITTETRNADDFDKLEVAGAFQVYVTYSSTESIEVEAPENLQKHIELNVRSEKLKIRVKKNTQIKSSCGLKIHIKTSKLNDFDISGASSVSLNNMLKDNFFYLKSSGAAKFSGELQVKEAEIKLNGASKAHLTGMATNANLELSGASNVNDYDFEVNNLNVDMSGASSAQITSLKSVKGDVSGASSLKYEGNPSVDKVHTSGAASVGRN